MEVSTWILVGVIVGIAAKLILKDFSHVLWRDSILLAIIGAISGGLISCIISIYIEITSEVYPVGSLISGAVGVLLLYQISLK
ncbi:hypothetical protein [Chryseobacterium chendengshani]|uniref:hypothetical protein n=1 Tax=Chryseobacterium sp. LJ756 TaxID=2864113 RepID=UPI001C643BAE|nr:hypothetical protein [Chryseobacterium sp. LJ756]MBW7674167.1 hypothetical protein [Chryseobacterium sp. LJ756]